MVPRIEMKRERAKQTRDSRRTFIKAVAYVAPAIVTLKAAPSFAAAGSQGEKPKPKPKPKG